MSLSGSDQDKIKDLLQNQNFEVFIANGTFVVPYGVTNIKITGCAAGGDGARGTSSSAGAGGKAGEGVVNKIISVTPGESLNVICGGGNTVLGNKLTLLANALEENIKMTLPIFGNINTGIGHTHPGGGYGGMFGYGGAYGNTQNSFVDATGFPGSGGGGAGGYGAGGGGGGMCSSAAGATGGYGGKGYTGLGGMPGQKAPNSTAVGAGKGGKGGPFGSGGSGNVAHGQQNTGIFTGTNGVGYYPGAGGKGTQNVIVDGGDAPNVLPLPFGGVPGQGFLYIEW